MNIVEGDTVPLWMVRPLLDHLITILQNLDLVILNEERDELIKNINHYFELSIELINISYSLTSSGRYKLRKELSNSLVNNFDINESHCPSPRIKGYSNEETTCVNEDYTDEATPFSEEGSTDEMLSQLHAYSEDSTGIEQIKEEEDQTEPADYFEVLYINPDVVMR